MRLRWWYFLLPVLIVLALGVILRLTMFASGTRVTSWWRTPWHNAEVGGASNSLHLFGLAVDVTPQNSMMMEWLLSLPIVNKVVVESDHLHAQVI